jgi:hypothetical protein
MVNINNVFTSDYLRAADLEEKPHLVTIKDVGMVTMQDNTQKLLVTFNEFDRGLLLNKTNAYNLSEYLGPDTDAWVGHQTVLFTAWVDFQGKSVEAIRVRKPKPQAAKPAAAPTPAPRELDDRVPF